MLLLGKNLNSINETDIQSLVDGEVSEGKNIEFKRELPGNSDSNRKEFLADVSSFANASGGHLIYGINESEGIANEITGLTISNIDSEKLRLESIIRDGIAPRIPGLKIHSIKLENTKDVIILEIPKSWAMPHMIIFKDHSRFYSRKSAGKYILDVAELRAAFVLSESIGIQIQNFRTERLGKILSGESIIPINEIPKTVFHIIPFNAFDKTKYIFDNSSLRVIEQSRKDFRPLESTSWNGRYNLDGYVVHDTLASGNPKSYTQFFRNGIIELVECSLLEPIEDNKIIPGKYYEKQLIDQLQKYLEFLETMGVETPLLVMLTLTGVLDYFIPNGSRISRQHTIDRDTLFLPEIIIEQHNINPSKAMKPIFDALYNASGFNSSTSYNTDGEWIE